MRYVRCVSDNCRQGRDRCPTPDACQRPPMTAWEYLRTHGRHEYRLARGMGKSRLRAIIETLKQAWRPAPF